MSSDRGVAVPRKQITEFWASSNETIVRSLRPHPSTEVPSFAAIFMQNSRMVIEFDILTPPTVYRAKEPSGSYSKKVTIGKGLCYKASLP